MSDTDSLTQIRNVLSYWLQPRSEREAHRANAISEANMRRRVDERAQTARHRLWDLQERVDAARSILLDSDTEMAHAALTALGDPFSIGARDGRTGDYYDPRGHCASCGHGAGDHGKRGGLLSNGEPCRAGLYSFSPGVADGCPCEGYRQAPRPDSIAARDETPEDDGVADDDPPGGWCTICGHRAGDHAKQGGWLFGGEPCRAGRHAFSAGDPRERCPCEGYRRPSVPLYLGLPDLGPLFHPSSPQPS